MDNFDELLDSWYLISFMGVFSATWRPYKGRLRAEPFLNKLRCEIFFLLFNIKTFDPDIPLVSMEVLSPFSIGFKWTACLLLNELKLNKPELDSLFIILILSLLPLF